MEKVILKNEQETIAFGEKLGSFLQPGDLITMEGDLGAGKTTMTKGIGKALGVKRVINSPTFNILKGYTGNIPLYHLDVYRLEGVSQELGFEEYYDHRRQSDRLLSGGFSVQKALHCQAGGT